MLSPHHHPPVPKGRRDFEGVRTGTAWSGDAASKMLSPQRPCRPGAGWPKWLKWLKGPPSGFFVDFPFLSVLEVLGPALS